MKEREQYIKPSVLRLDYSVDTDVVSFSSCKSAFNNNGRITAPNSTLSCQSTSCSSVTDS